MSMRSTIQRCAMRCCMSSLIRLTPLTSRNVTTSPKARCLAPARSVRSARPRRTARSMVTRRPPSAQRGAGHLAQVGHAARVGRGLSWGAPRGRRPSLGPAPRRHRFQGGGRPLSGPACTNNPDVTGRVPSVRVLAPGDISPE